MKNMIPATNGKSIYIPPPGDWRLRRFDEASTLDETVPSKSFGPFARPSPTVLRILAEEMDELSLVSRPVSEHPPYGLKDALVSGTPSVRTPHRILHSPSAPARYWPFWKRKDTINKPCILPFFAKLGFCFCVYYSSGGNRHTPTAGRAVRPSHRIFFTNYAFKAEAVV